MNKNHRPSAPPNRSTSTSARRGSRAPWYVYVMLSCSTLISSYASIRALRHVSYLMKILSKTCKPIPILLFSTCTMKKRYPRRKYISVMLLTLGASVFLMSCNNDDHDKKGGTNETNDAASMAGPLWLVLSLLMDGTTGVLEDHFLVQYEIHPLSLMARMHAHSCVFSLMGVYLSQKHGTLEALSKVLGAHSNTLGLLGLTGSAGQMCIFFLLKHFGALVTSMVGAARKVLTITLSICVFGHVLTRGQALGLMLTFAGMGVNLMRQGSRKHHAQDVLKNEKKFEHEDAKTLLEPHADVFATQVDAVFRATTAV